MYLLDTPNGIPIAYAAHPRTASHSTAQVFLTLGAEKVQRHHDFSAALLPPDCLVLAGTRNHFDAICSWRAFLGGTGTRYPSLKAMAVSHLKKGYYGAFSPKYARLQNSTGQLMMWPYARVATHLVRFEHLEQDLTRVLRKLGFETIPRLPRLVVKQPNRTPHYWRGKITPEDREWIEETFPRELTRHNYEW